MSTISRADYMFLMRKPVRSPERWSLEAGTDFWLMGGVNGLLTSGNAQELADYGWVTTALSQAGGSGADLLSPADVGVPSLLITDAVNDLLQSPAIFGDYAHARMAQALCGMRSLPRLLVAEMYGSFSPFNQVDAQGGFGFQEDTATTGVATDQLAWIGSDGTRFFCGSGDSLMGLGGGPLADGNPHLFRIELNRIESLTKWSVDGVPGNPIPLENDEFPCKFAMYGGANFPRLAWAHVYYDW